MKILPVFFVLIFSISVFAQSTTYSKEEEHMISYVNNAWGQAKATDTTDNLPTVLDSCWKFLEKYPRSFAKPNVFSGMLEITFLITKDLAKINPLIDTVLFYDNLPGAKESIGEHLIVKNIDIQKGRKLINEALLITTDEYHIFKSHINLAKSDIALGDFASAKVNYNKALKADPSRSEGWFEYLGYLTMMNQTSEADKILKTIDQMEKEDKFNNRSCAYVSKVIGKTVLDKSLNDINGKPVSLNSLKGKVCVIKFFNYWYGYYKKEFPQMKRLKKEYPDVEFVFINYGRAGKKLQDRFFSSKEFSFLKKHKLLLGENEFTKKEAWKWFPRSIVIDKAGVIRYDYLGYTRDLESTLHFNLQKLVNE